MLSYPFLVAGQGDPRRDYTQQVQLLNACTDNLLNMIKSVYELQQDLNQRSGRSSWMPWRYECPARLEPYYQEQAQEKSGTVGKRLKPQTDQLLASFKKVEDKCRDLEIYFRLKSFEKDDFAGVPPIIQDFHKAVVEFNQTKSDFETALTADHARQKPAPPPPAYTQAIKNLRIIAEREQNLIASLRWNFNPQLPTTWPVDAIQKQINELDVLLTRLQSETPRLDYPASHYYSAFLDCALQSQAAKKDLVDGYTPEARKTDDYPNRAYLQMINYYNGCLVPFFNQLTDSWPAGKAFPLKLGSASASFELVARAEPATFRYSAFADIPYQPFELPAQTQPVSARLNKALNTYVEFIDMSVRITNNLITGLQNNRINQTSFPSETNLYYNDDTHELPKSLYQETILANANLPEAARQSVKDQAEVLYRMLSEMDLLRVELLQIVQEKRYKKEGFARTEAIRDRYRLLFSQFDAYKERLFEDIQKIRSSWAEPQPESSWLKAWRSMAQVLEADRQLLDAAADYFTKKTETPAFDLAKQQSAVETHIREEYNNMKGIQRIGRNNGLCPYNPYEYMAEISQRMGNIAEGYGKKTYHDFIYPYNDAVISYNQLVDLSPIPLLKTTRQLEKFLLIPAPTPRPNTSKPAETPRVEPKTKSEKEIPNSLRDTVYIRDTIYIEKTPPVNQAFYSLEGHAANNLILLLDISASMNAPDRLPLLQSSLETLIKLLRPEDALALVVFSGTARVEQTSASGSEKERLLQAVRNLKPGGKTDINAGLNLAYQQAQQNYKRPGNNRIILATDGEFALTNPILERIRENAQADIHLSVFKFGPKPTPELKRLAEVGKGNLMNINADNAVIFMIMEAKK